MMKISNKGLALIKRNEGCRLQAYRCPAGIWTIGYGHTGANVIPGDKITMEVADMLLRTDVQKFEKVIDSLRANLNQNQFDALVSFVYNVGPGNFASSTLVKKVVVNPHDQAIRAEFEKWVYGGDGSKNGTDDDKDGVTDEPGERQRLPGLEKRRKEEADLYFS